MLNTRTDNVQSILTIMIMIIIVCLIEWTSKHMYAGLGNTRQAYVHTIMICKSRCITLAMLLVVAYSYARVLFIILGTTLGIASTPKQ